MNSSGSFRVTEGMDDFVSAAKGSHDASGASSNFDSLWARLGECVRSSNVGGVVTPRTSFGCLAFGDVVMHLRAAAPDENNFWSSPDLVGVKLTTYAHIGGEAGFMQHALRSHGPLLYVALEAPAPTPSWVSHDASGSRMLIVPFVISPTLLLFFVQTLVAGHAAVVPKASLDPATLGSSLDDPHAQAPPASSSPMSLHHEFSCLREYPPSSHHHHPPHHPSPSSHALKDLADMDVESLLVQWKSERAGAKPTIPKLAEFAKVEQERIKKSIAKIGRSWTEMLVSHGFR